MSNKFLHSINFDKLPRIKFQICKRIHWDFNIHLKWFKYSRGFQFTWLDFLFQIEDTRPDIVEWSTKYKTQIRLVILNRVIISFIVRSAAFPFAMVNNKEI